MSNIIIIFVEKLRMVSLGSKDTSPHMVVNIFNVLLVVLSETSGFNYYFYPKVHTQSFTD